jgi:carotenoid cleavage dioxygenase-like enzyme
MKTGECREDRISDTIQEFGMTSGRYGGLPYRYSYNALPAKGWLSFEGIIKQAHERDTEEVVLLPKGVYASETVMAQRIGSTAENDGYLITFTMDMNEDRSKCLTLNAASPNDESVACTLLPERMSPGTHAFCQPGERL